MTDNENEFFDIPNLNGYKINKKGEIYSDKSKKKLTQGITNGYNLVKLGKQGYAVHRLVALTF